MLIRLIQSHRLRQPLMFLAQQDSSITAKLALWAPRLYFSQTSGVKSAHCEQVKRLLWCVFPCLLVGPYIPVSAADSADAAGGEGGAGGT